MPTPTQQLLSQTIYTTDGLTSDWNFSFAGGYLDTSHVKAYYTDSLGARTDVLAFTLSGPYQLHTTYVLPAGLMLVIYRDTPKTAPIVDFTDGSGLTELALDTNARQAIMLAAEAADANVNTSTIGAEASAGAAAASALAASNSAISATASAIAAAASAEVAAGRASAAMVGFAPAGSITSTTVQAAIEEVATDLTASIAANITSIQDGTVFLLTSVAGTNTITASIAPAITAYVIGQTFRFVAAGANTGAVTININGLGAKAVTKSGATALSSGDIPAGAAVQIFYDGTQFQLSSGAGGGSSGVNLLTQANGVSVLAGTGQVLVGPITIPTGQNITVASGARLVIL